MLRQLRWPFLVAVLLALSGCSPEPEVKTGPTQSPEQTASIAWSYDYQAALALAKEQNKPLMVDVFATWCKPCQMLDEEVFSRPDVAESSQNFVCVKLDGDKNPDLREKLGVTGYPTVVFLSPDGRALRRSRGLVPYSVMLREMAAAAEQAGAAQPESD
ncbi:MAG: thioredoxin family protein [Armatimonadota bacterium]|nr:MAG: thioredoxin family protein [Armatimonadota bacterium]